MAYKLNLFDRNHNHSLFENKSPMKELTPNLDIINDLRGYTSLEKFLRSNAEYIISEKNYKTAETMLENFHVNTDGTSYVNDLLCMTLVFVDRHIYQSRSDYRKAEKGRRELKRLIQEVILLNEDESQFEFVKVSVKRGDFNSSNFMFTDFTIVQNLFHHSTEKDLNSVRIPKKEIENRNNSIKDFADYLKNNYILTKPNTLQPEQQIKLIKEWFIWVGILKEDLYTDFVAGIRQILKSKEY